MAKAESTVFSEIHGGLKNIDFRTRFNKSIEIGTKRIPQNPRTQAQINHRNLYGLAVHHWNHMAQELKDQWMLRSSLLNLSGYQAYMKEALKDCRALYTFYEGEGNVLHDLSGHNNHGTIYGATWQGQTLYFDGTDDHVNCGTIGTLNAPFTARVKVYFNNLNQPADNFDYALLIGSGGDTISISRWQSNGDVNKYYSFTEETVLFGPALPGQEWLDLKVIWNNISPFHSLYINNVPQSVDQPSAALQTNGVLSLGYYSPNGSHHIDGILKEVGIYGTA